MGRNTEKKKRQDGRNDFEVSSGNEGFVQRVKNLFEKYFSDLDRLQNAQSVTEADLQLLDEAKKDIETCEQDMSVDLEEGPKKILKSIRLLFDSATVNVNRAELVEKGNDGGGKKAKKTVQRVDEPPKSKMIDHAVLETQEEQYAKFVEQCTRDWRYQLTIFEKRLENLKQRMSGIDFTQEQVMGIYQNLKDDFYSFGEKAIDPQLLRYQANPDDMPDAWKMFIAEWLNFKKEQLEPYSAVVQNRTADLEKRKEELANSEVAAQTFRESANKQLVEIETVLAMPVETQEDRAAVRAAWNSLKIGHHEFFQAWNNAEQGAVKFLQGTWPKAWRAAVVVYQDVGKRYKILKEKMGALESREVQGWNNQVKTLSTRVSVLRVRYDVAKLEPDEQARKGLLEGINNRLNELRNEYWVLHGILPKDGDVQEFDALDRRMKSAHSELEQRNRPRKVDSNLAGVVDRLSKRILTLSVVWREGKTETERTEFLLDYILRQEVACGDARYVTFVADQELFEEVTGYLRQAYARLEAKEAMEVPKEEKVEVVVPSVVPVAVPAQELFNHAEIDRSEAVGPVPPPPPLPEQPQPPKPPVIIALPPVQPPSPTTTVPPIIPPVVLNDPTMVPDKKWPKPPAKPVVIREISRGRPSEEAQPSLPPPAPYKPHEPVEIEPAVVQESSPVMSEPVAPKIIQSPLPAVEASETSAPNIVSSIPESVLASVAPEIPPEERVSHWATRAMARVRRMFGGTEVAPERVSAPLEQVSITPEVQTMQKTQGLFAALRGAFGGNVLRDIPRFFSNAFLAEKQRAALSADILTAMNVNAPQKGGAHNSEEANVHAAQRLERAIQQSALSVEQKNAMLQKVVVLREKYQQQTRENVAERSKELAVLLEEVIREKQSPALEVFSGFWGSVGAGVAYGVQQFRERFERVVAYNPEARVVTHVAAVFRETWEEAQASMHPGAGHEPSFMTMAEAMATIGAAYAIGTTVTALEKALPSMRAVEAENANPSLIARARLRIQNFVDKILSSAEKRTAREVRRG